MRITIIGVFIKLLTLVISSLLNTGIYSLIIAEITNILVVVLLNIYYVYKNSKKL